MTEQLAPSTYQLPHVQPAAQPGMGAIPYDGGVAFRVWAPYAEQMYVVGSFNHYNLDSHPLAREDAGYWSVSVPEAMVNDTYKFRILNGEHEFMRIDPYAREVTHSIGEAIIHDPKFSWNEDQYHTPAWHEMVIYEMHVGTFHVVADAAQGTFDSAIEKLPYLQQLGINSVLVMPPMEFPGDLSWGYNPAHPYAIETAYGGPHAFKRFVQAAHAHGIAVVLDVVYNHFGPSDLDLWQFDGWNEQGMGGIYFYNDWRSATPWGDTRPDYGRAEVRQYLRDNALMWLQEYHVDGLRFDATAFIRNVTGNGNPDEDLPEGWNLLRWINDEINAQQPWKITIAEDLRRDPLITAETSAGGAGFDAQWDAGFVHPIRATITAERDDQRDNSDVIEAICLRYNDDAFRRVIYTESHDEVANGKARVPEEIWPTNAGSLFAKKRSTLGAGLVLTSPGIPMIFQGQEFVEDGWFEDQNALDWNKAEQNAGIVQLYHDLLLLRRNMHGTTRGLTGQYVHVFHNNPTEHVIAFHRWSEGGSHDSVVVVANLSNTTHSDYWIGLPGAGVWQVQYNSDWSGYDPEFSNTPTLDLQAINEPLDDLQWRGMLNIGPYSLVILSLAP